jgi:hypothetical protein
VQHEQHQRHYRHHLDDRRYHAKPCCVQYAQQHAAQRENKQRGKHTSQHDRNPMRTHLVKVSTAANRRQHYRGKDIASPQKEREKADQRGCLRRQHLQRPQRKRRQNKKVNPVGEEHLPLKDRDCSHHYKREQHEEVADLHRRPERQLAVVGLQKKWDH